MTQERPCVSFIFPPSPNYVRLRRYSRTVVMRNNFKNYLWWTRRAITELIVNFVRINIIAYVIFPFYLRFKEVFFYIYIWYIERREREKNNFKILINDRIIFFFYLIFYLIILHIFLFLNFYMQDIYVSHSITKHNFNKYFRMIWEN